MGMSWWRDHKTATIMAAVAVVVLAAIAVPVLLPSDTDDYRNSAVKAAQDTMSEVRTVRLALAADLAGKTYDTYLSTVLWKAHDQLSSTASDLASQEVPDQTAAGVQTRLSDLVGKAIDAVGAADVATGLSDEDARHAATEKTVQRLDDVGNQLEDFTQATAAELNA